MLTESHEKSEAWKQVWYLTQRNAAGEFTYRRGLTAEERVELLNFLYDVLDHERRVTLAEIGKVLPAPDNSPDERDEAAKKDQSDAVLTVPEIETGGGIEWFHDPKLYSFGLGLDWIPWAEDTVSGAKRGTYAKGYPIGLLVHWTAGHRNGLAAGNELMRNTGMLYLLGDAKGRLAQSDSLKHHGYHGGQSSYKGISGYVSDDLVGLELQAAGGLTKRSDGGYYSWFGTRIAEPEVAVSPVRRDNIQAGAYHVYTIEQYHLLRRLACWLYLNKPGVFNPDFILGHDEVAPGRKSDPGGSILDPADGILSMPQLRRVIRNDVDKIEELRKKAA